jgi:hypothetical protein
MSGRPAPEYVLARRVLLDALDALGVHRDAVILIGAQAIYLHTGDGDLAVAPFTTDADIALAPDRLRDKPLLEDALLAAGFTPGSDPGTWRGAHGVPVDLMVPDAVAGTSGRRGARLPRHGKRVARRARGLEPALVDNAPHRITSFDDADHRVHVVGVAGHAALLVAKTIKLAERSEQPGRLAPKDALDILRLLQASDTRPLASRLVELTNDPLAGDVTRDALAWPEKYGRDRGGPPAALLLQAVGGVGNQTTMVESLIALVDDLLRDYGREDTRH